MASKVTVLKKTKNKKKWSHIVQDGLELAVWSRLALDPELPASAVSRGLYHLWPQEMQNLVSGGGSVYPRKPPDDGINSNLASVEASIF